MKVLSALGSAFFAFLIQVFMLAAAEGFGGLHIRPFGSRTPLLIMMLAVSLGAAVLRWRKLRALELSAEPIAPQQSQAAPPAQGGELSPEMQERLDRMMAKVRADQEAMLAHGAMAAVVAAPIAAGSVPVAAPPSGAAKRDELIEAASRQAILFRQLFPPPHDDSILSFWGGAPIAPAGFEWPRSAAGKPLHFLMQVDCSAIPAAARLGALPDNGVLYFFLDLEWGEDGGHAVSYQPAGADWAAVSPPGDLGPLFGKEAAYSCAWAQTAEQCPNLFAKWPFEPVAIEVPEIVPEDEEEEDYPALWPERAVEERIVAVGDVAESNYFTIKDVIDGRAIRRPFPGFPQDWRAVQISSAMLVKRAEDTRRFPQGQFREMEEAAREQLLTGIAADAQQWFDRAAAQPPFDAVPEADRDSFWEFLASHSDVARMTLTEATTDSIEASLAGSADAAARIAPEIADRIRSRHALAVRTESGFHVNIPDRMLAPPIDVQGNQWERAQSHLLLLEISSNEGLGHRFGEGVYQFWIAPDDLRAGRFDRVELTSDAY
jgi:hypothetical protein